MVSGAWGRDGGAGQGIQNFTSIEGIKVRHLFIMQQANYSQQGSTAFHEETYVLRSST